MSHESIEAVKPKVALTELFPEIKPESEAPYVKTKKKLGFQEDTVCKQLIKKYGETGFLKMAKDIKINCFQWSKGLCEQKIRTYLDHYQ